MYNRFLHAKLKNDEIQAAKEEHIEIINKKRRRHLHNRYVERIQQWMMKQVKDSNDSNNHEPFLSSHTPNSLSNNKARTWIDTSGSQAFSFTFKNLPEKERVQQVQDYYNDILLEKEPFLMQKEVLLRDRQRHLEIQPDRMRFDNWKSERERLAQQELVLLTSQTRFNLDHLNTINHIASEYNPSHDDNEVSIYYENDPKNLNNDDKKIKSRDTALQEVLKYETHLNERRRKLKRQYLDEGQSHVNPHDITLRATNVNQWIGGNFTSLNKLPGIGEEPVSSLLIQDDFEEKACISIYGMSKRFEKRFQNPPQTSKRNRASRTIIDNEYERTNVPDAKKDSTLHFSPQQQINIQNKPPIHQTYDNTLQKNSSLPQGILKNANTTLPKSEKCALLHTRPITHQSTRSITSYASNPAFSARTLQQSLRPSTNLSTRSEKSYNRSLQDMLHRSTAKIPNSSSAISLFAHEFDVANAKEVLSRNGIERSIPIRKRKSKSGNLPSIDRFHNGKFPSY